MNLSREELPPELADFPAVVRLPIQWGDQDSFGHVNNVVHFRWFESARIAYFEQLGMTTQRPPAGVGPILAAISCNYRRQLVYPGSVLVGARITRIGRTSLTMLHAIFSETQTALAADGESTVVMFDYAANQPHPVPSELRAAIEAAEGPTL